MPGFFVLQSLGPLGLLRVAYGFVNETDTRPGPPTNFLYWAAGAIFFRVWFKFLCVYEACVRVMCPNHEHTNHEP